MSNTCLYCNKELIGRIDKKFCDASCRNSYNNIRNSDTNKTMRNINNRLRKNRRILSSILGPEESVKKVQKDFLLKKGFDFTYFTHTYTNKKEAVYHYVYDMGYLALNATWYIIVRRDESS